MRLVPVNCIKEGSFLARTIYDLDGRILLTKGVRLSDRIIEKVKLNGIMSLYINDEYSETEIEDIIKPEIRQKAIKTIKESFEAYQKFYENNKISKNKSVYKMKNKYIKDISDIVNDILDEILSKKNALINLVDIKSMDNYTYEHCVNVTVLSILLALEMNMPKERMYNLALGAMLHDIGKVFVPKEVLLKNGRLSEAEFNAMKEHTVKGYEYLKSDENIAPVSRIVILQHHERVDGTGYPDGLRGENIHEFSKITSLVDVYDALTSDRPYRLAMSPNDALEFIMGSSGRYFDSDIVNAFLKRVVPYPIGTLVKLSNGDIGVVETINMGYPLRPVVKVIRGSGLQKQVEYIDLLEVKNIVIKGVQYKVTE